MLTHSSICYTLPWVCLMNSKFLSPHAHGEAPKKRAHHPVTSRLRGTSWIGTAGSGFGLYAWWCSSQTSCTSYTGYSAECSSGKSPEKGLKIRHLKIRQISKLIKLVGFTEQKTSKWIKVIFFFFYLATFTSMNAVMKSWSHVATHFTQQHHAVQLYKHKYVV